MIRTLIDLFLVPTVIQSKRALCVCVFIMTKNAIRIHNKKNAAEAAAPSPLPESMPLI